MPEWLAYYRRLHCCLCCSYDERILVSIFRRERIIWRYQLFEEGQYAQTLSDLCGNATIEGYWTVQSTQFPSRCLGQPGVCVLGHFPNVSSARSLSAVQSYRSSYVPSMICSVTFCRAVSLLPRVSSSSLRKLYRRTKKLKHSRRTFSVYLEMVIVFSGKIS